MSSSSSFDGVLSRLRDGDDRTAEEVHRRFVRRLVALAYRQFAPWLRERADHEDVVQSAFRSFFARSERGEFLLDDWDDLWSLLATITVHKCRRRYTALRRLRRDSAREVADSWPDREASGPLRVAVDRDPTPAEAAELTETLERWLLGLDDDERRVTELILQGCPTPEIARRLGRTERTVRRIHQHARDRLTAMLAVEPA